MITIQQAFLFACMLFVALAWGPSAGHLLELPNKMRLGREEYRTVQQIYRGWQWLGIVVLGALVSSGAFAWAARGSAWFAFALVALLCLLGTQVLFWTVTFPANRATEDWRVLPDGWTELRRRWEYAHALSAGLNLLAFLALLMAAGRMIGERAADVRDDTGARILVALALPGPPMASWSLSPERWASGRRTPPRPAPRAPDPACAAGGRRRRPRRPRLAAARSEGARDPP